VCNYLAAACESMAVSWMVAFDHNDLCVVSGFDARHPKVEGADARQVRRCLGAGLDFGACRRRSNASQPDPPRRGRTW
jgi:hypothetical protein